MKHCFSVWVPQFGCSYLVSSSKHSHQIEAIWIALFLFEHSLESRTKPRVFFSCGQNPWYFLRNGQNLWFVHTYKHLLGFSLCAPFHESKSNREGIQPSTWRTWICSLTFAEGRSNRSKTHLIASICKEICIFRIPQKERKYLILGTIYHYFGVV